MKTVKSLTPKQKKFFEKVKSYIANNQYSPSFKEMSWMISSEQSPSALSTVQYYVDTLIKKGYLLKNEDNERGIALASEPNFTIPLLGYIAAGSPIEPIENPEPIEVPPSINLKPNCSYYALRIKGDSMEDMGILDDDIVIIKNQFYADNGDIVVAITEKGATLKEFQFRTDGPWLCPKNLKYKPFKPETLEIRGLFKGLIRSN